MYGKLCIEQIAYQWVNRNWNSRLVNHKTADLTNMLLNTLVNMEQIDNWLALMIKEYIYV